MATEFVVTPQSVFRLSAAGSLEEIQLSPETWRVNAQIDGARTVAEIASNLQTDPAVVERAAAELYRLGLLRENSESDEATQPARRTMSGAFFDQIEAEFIKAIGPFAPILIEDEVASLGATF